MRVEQTEDKDFKDHKEIKGIKELKLSPVVWCLEIAIFTFLMLTLCFSVALYICSPDPTYILFQYVKNWQANYILDIQVSRNLTCPVNYELKQIGLWSGIEEGSCLCHTNSTFHQIILENPDECNDFSEDSGFICKKLNKKDPIPLYRYKNGISFCVLRSRFDFVELWKMSKKYIRENYNHSYPSDPKMLISDKYYMDFLKTKTPFQLISPNALIDIKILNTSQFSIKNLQEIYGYDLSESAGYTKEEIEPNYYLFKKRIGYDTPIINVNKLISDIRLSNELQCAYLDMSPPEGQYTIKSYHDFGGFRYCENLVERFSLAYEDTKRTESLFFNFDPSPSKQDFYTPNGVTDYYHYLGQKFNKRDMFSPSMVFEKYFSGIGCLLHESIEDHFHRLNSGFVLVSLSKVFTAFSFLTLALLLILYGCKLVYSNSRLLFILIIGVLFLNLFLLILSFSKAVITYKLRNYLKEFSFYCQTDFMDPKGDVKTTKMELLFYNDLFYPYGISVFLTLVLLINLFFISFYLFIQCRKKTLLKAPDNDKHVIVFQGNERKINMNQELDNVEHVFNELEKSELKSRN